MIMLKKRQSRNIKLRKIKGKIEKKAKNLFLLSLFRFFYMFGLSLIIPFVLSLALVPETIWRTPINLISGAIILILIGFWGLLSVEKDLGRTLKFMGLATLIPAFISLFLSLFGEQLILSYLKNIYHVPFTKEILSLIEIYIEKTIPKFGFLTIGYFLLGLLLYVLGIIIRKQNF